MEKLKTAGILTLLGAIMPLMVFSPVFAAGWIAIYNGYVTPSPIARQVLTTDGTDTYDIVKTGGGIDASAPATNASSNLREIYWPSATEESVDSQVCTVWSSESSAGVQQGLATRIVQTETSTKAVTVTKNIFFGATWLFNVHTWDTSNLGAYNQVAYFDYSNVVGKIDETGNTLKPVPWKTCMRVTGQTLQFKLWVTGSEPSWSNPTYVRSTTIPAEFVYPGRTGWYVGHIPPGGTSRIDSLRILKYVQQLGFKLGSRFSKTGERIGSPVLLPRELVSGLCSQPCCYCSNNVATITPLGA